MVKDVSHIDMFILRKFTKTGGILNKSKTLIPNYAVHYQRLYDNQSKPYSNFYVLICSPRL